MENDKQSIGCHNQTTRHGSGSTRGDQNGQERFVREPEENYSKLNKKGINKFVTDFEVQVAKLGVWSPWTLISPTL